MKRITIEGIPEELVEIMTFTDGIMIEDDNCLNHYSSYDITGKTLIKKNKAMFLKEKYSDMFISIKFEYDSISGKVSDKDYASLCNILGYSIPFEESEDTNVYWFFIDDILESDTNYFMHDKYEISDINCELARDIITLEKKHDLIHDGYYSIGIDHDDDFYIRKIPKDFKSPFKVVLLDGREYRDRGWFIANHDDIVMAKLKGNIPHEFSKMKIEPDDKIVEKVMEKAKVQ